MPSLTPMIWVVIEEGKTIWVLLAWEAITANWEDILDTWDNS